MPRMDLNVPFAEKDDAKRLGARWDAQRKTWYVPDGVETSVFWRWINATAEIDVWAPHYFIAESRKHCWKCRAPTRVYGLVLPDSHQTVNPDSENSSEDTWFQFGEPTILIYVTALLPSVAARMAAMTRHYRIDFSKTVGGSYWMNHCEACGMKQGDFELYCEPTGAFFPMSEHDATQIVLHGCAEPFGGCADTSYGDHFFESMRQVPPRLPLITGTVD